MIKSSRVLRRDTRISVHYVYSAYEQLIFQALEAFTRDQGGIWQRHVGSVIHKYIDSLVTVGIQMYCTSRTSPIKLHDIWQPLFDSVKDRIREHVANTFLFELKLSSFKVRPYSMSLPQRMFYKVPVITYATREVAVYMALHDRLGDKSELKLLGPDNLQAILKLVRMP